MLPLLAEAASDDKILLVKPVPGLAIWTLLTFFIVLYILKKKAFGPIAAALEARRQAVEDNINASEVARHEAERLLGDYKTQLAQSRREAAEIGERARRQADEDRKRLTEELTAERERGIADAKARIQMEAHAADRPDQGRDVGSDAAGDAERPPPQARRRRVAAPDRRGPGRDRLLPPDRVGCERLMADAAAIPYAEAIYSAAKDAGRLREVSRGLTSFVQSLDESPELDGLLANPAFPLDRKRTVIEEVTKSDEPLLTSSLTVLMSNGRYALVRDVAGRPGRPRAPRRARARSRAHDRRR